MSLRVSVIIWYCILPSWRTIKSKYVNDLIFTGKSSLWTGLWQYGTVEEVSLYTLNSFYRKYEVPAHKSSKAGCLKVNFLHLHRVRSNFKTS